jgi:outer membrane lipoprotein LolB
VKHIIWILSLMLLVSGCSTTKQATTTTTTTPTAPKATWANREARLSSIHRWHLSGKIALQTSHDSGSASVDWSQSQNQYNISLQGPLGAGAMKLKGQAGLVTLQTSDGKSYQAASAEQLLAKQWGFHLPVSNMNYWIRGLPVPGTPANTRFDQDGRIATIIQRGFRIDYLAYSNANGIDLPEKMTIVSSALRVKMIVYQWNLA